LVAIVSIATKYDILQHILCVALGGKTSSGIKDGKDMAETRVQGLSVKKQGFRGLSARNQGPKCNYAYKPKVYSTKG
jgi:hypothetical protein